MCYIKFSRRRVVPLANVAGAEDAGCRALVVRREASIQAVLHGGRGGREGRDLEFLGKSSFVDLARLLRLVGSKRTGRGGMELGWAGLGSSGGLVIWQSGATFQPRPALGTRSGSDV